MQSAVLEKGHLVRAVVHNGRCKLINGEDVGGASVWSSSLQTLNQFNKLVDGSPTKETICFSLNHFDLIKDEPIYTYVNLQISKDNHAMLRLSLLDGLTNKPKSTGNYACDVGTDPKKSAIVLYDLNA